MRVVFRSTFGSTAVGLLLLLPYFCRPRPCHNLFVLWMYCIKCLCVPCKALYKFDDYYYFVHFKKL